MATLQRIYKGGKKVCETKSKTELVNALYNKSSKKKLGKCSSVGAIKRKKAAPKKPTSRKISKVNFKKYNSLYYVGSKGLKLRYSALIAYQPYNNDFFVFDAAPFYALDILADYKKYFGQTSGYYPEFKILDTSSKLKHISKGSLKKLWKENKGTFTEKQNENLGHYFK